MWSGAFVVASSGAFRHVDSNAYSNADEGSGAVSAPRQQRALSP
jgi:hypothetical protein